MRYYNGCPLFKTTDVLRWHIEATGFGFQAEFLTRLLHEGRDFIEVEVESFERTQGTANALTLKNWMSVTHTLSKLALRRLRKMLFGR